MKCPLCNSEDTEIYGDQEVTWQDAECNDCGYEWQWNEFGDETRVLKDISSEDE